MISISSIRKDKEVTYVVQNIYKRLLKDEKRGFHLINANWKFDIKHIS